MRSLSLLIIFVIATTTFAHSALEWESRSIYQILTDRFAKSNNDTTPCEDLRTYCGGTFQGITDNLDYIQGMGFNAIWISPVVINTPGGYHGYWAQDIYGVNPHFGTPEDLKTLVKRCHEKDIWVMVDVVANHMGYELNSSFSDFIPFNKAEYYNNNTEDCSQANQTDLIQLDTCWLAQLPDLNQNNAFVRSQLLAWINNLVLTYDLDGIRIDTVAYVEKDFWREFSDAAGVFTIGEVLNGDVNFVSRYQGYVDGLLNYPLYFFIQRIFQQNTSMSGFAEFYNTASVFPDQKLLGNFVDNHDNARFLYSNSSHAAFRSALAFTITTIGIPIVYYGSELYYNGGNDPDNREVLWTNITERLDAYNFLAAINEFRKTSQFYKYDQIERHSDDSFYAFTRGEYFFAFTNSLETQERTMRNHPYSDGTTLCNVLSPSDCVTIENKQLIVSLKDGEVKVYSQNPTHKNAETVTVTSTHNFEA